MPTNAELSLPEAMGLAGAVPSLGTPAAPPSAKGRSADGPQGAARPADAAATKTGEAGADNPRDLLKRQQAVVAMGRRAIASPETSILLHDAAVLIAEMLDAEYFGIAELAPEGDELAFWLSMRQADRSDPPLACKTLNASGDQSLAAHALRVAHPVVSADLPAEDAFRDALLEKLGMRSVLAAPLRLQDRAFGVLVACSVSPRRFRPQDALFAETIGHLAATAVARSHAEKNLAEEQSFALGMLQAIGAVVLVLDGEGRAVRINRVCEQVSGFSLADLAERPIWNVFATAGEAELYRASLEKLRRGAQCAEFESSLMTKHFQPRRIRWSWGGLPGDKGTVETVLATGIDVTEQYEANRRAERAEQAAQRAEQAAAEARKLASLLPAAKPDGKPIGPPPGNEGQTSPAAVEGLAGPLNQTLRERRRRQRRAFPYCQSIAPIMNGRLPPRDQLRSVQCHDITAGGFAYLSEGPPESDLLVVALGAGANLTHLIAQVVHATPTERDGKHVYLIGCTYTGRAPY